ncbi:MAG TPA: hypothetical protein VF490_11900 [Chryseosolibacter sp.]
MTQSQDGVIRILKCVIPSIWPIMAIGYARFLEGLSGNRKACFSVASEGPGPVRNAGGTAIASQATTMNSFLVSASAKER